MFWSVGHSVVFPAAPSKPKNYRRRLPFPRDRSTYNLWRYVCVCVWFTELPQYGILYGSSDTVPWYTIYIASVSLMSVFFWIKLPYIWHLPTNILIKCLCCNPIHNTILSRYVNSDVYHGVTLLCVCTVSMGIVCVGVCCECKCCVGFV